MAAMLSVLVFVLGKVSVPIGMTHISFSSLPIVFAASCLPLPVALSVAGIGELMCQAFSQYGLTPTTTLWIIPPMMRALLIWTGRRFFVRNSNIESRIGRYIAIVAFAGIVTNGLNTFVWWFDAMIIGYPFSYTAISIVARLITGLVTGVVVAIINVPLLKAARFLTEKIR